MPPRHQLVAARIAYVAIVVLATLADLNFSPDLAAAGERLARALSPSVGWRDAIDGLRNEALFAGLGAVWVVTSLTGYARSEVGRATLAGAVLSVLVEGAQCFSSLRTASLVDVATNTTGVLLGATGTVVVLWRVRSARGARSYFGVPALLVSGSYLVAVLCEALTPLFRSNFLVSDAVGPGYRFAVALDRALPLSIAEIPLLDVPLFGAAGFFAVLVFAEGGRSLGRSALVVAVAAGPALVVAHLLHGFFGLPIRFEAAAVDVIAVGLGAWLAQRWLAAATQRLRGPERARALIGAYAGLLVLWGWRPLLPVATLREITDQFTAVRFIPLASLAERVDVFSAAHVVQQFALYVPLGAVLAVWPCRSQGRWSDLRPALALAGIIEIGHLVISDRFFDVTNAMIAVAGLAMGWIVVRRSGYTPYGESFPAPARSTRRG